MSLLSNIVGSTQPSTTTATSTAAGSVQNIEQLAQTAATLSGNPAIAAGITAAVPIVNNLLGATSSNTSTTALVLPAAPTQAQLQAALQAVITAQTAYNQLLAQQKAVVAYMSAYSVAMQSLEVNPTVPNAAVNG